MRAEAVILRSASSMKYSLVPTSPERSAHVSYGLICVSSVEECAIVVVSPPYVALNIYNHSVKRKKVVTLNSNQGHDIMLGSFKNGFAEGTFTLPRGHRDRVDENDDVRTKIREFVEETGLYHPQFKDYSTLRLHHDFYEEWIGLNNVHYKANYSLFIVNSIKEFVPVERKQPQISKLLFSNKRVNYRYNARYDLFNRYAFISLRHLGIFMNNNKYKRIVDVDVDKIVKIVDREKKKKQI